MLVRIFSFLRSPLPYFESFLGPQVANTPDSPAATLAYTCRRLAGLYRTRVVSCVDLSRTSCNRSLPSALQYFPAVDAAVLGSLRDAHAAQALRGEGAECVPRLRSLCLTSVPGEDFAEALVAAVPQLLALDVQAMGNFRGGAARTGIAPLRSFEGGEAERAGLARLLAILPSRLRRLSLYYPAASENEEMDAALWDSLASMHELEELAIENAYALPLNAASVVKRCVTLVKISVDSVRCEAWGASASEFVSALPSSVASVSLKLSGSTLAANCFAEAARQVSDLRIVDAKLTNWKLLEPIAGTLCALSLSSCAIVNPGGILSDDVVPVLRSLKRLCLNDVDGLGFALNGCLSSLDRLEVLELHAEHLFSPSIAIALRDAAFGRTLRSLKITIGDAEAVIGGDAGGGLADVLPVAIGHRFPSLISLKIHRASLGHAGISALARGCPGLTCLSLSDCATFDDAAGALVGARLPRLETLDLSGTSIGRAGLAAIGRGCTQLANLSVSGCAAVDDAAIAAVGRTCGELRALDAGGTCVSADGLTALGDGCGMLAELKLRGCMSVDDAAATAVAACMPELRGLDLDKTSVSSVGLEALASGCRRLTRLTLVGCREIDATAAAHICNRAWRLTELWLP